ncbi:MAG TPA: glycosyltransferase family 87 protein [Thermoanaerobaculia bacterium]|nr:glycosyltransferase family 87 protein [Thermoanaerobaculia bacterium]
MVTGEAEAVRRRDFAIGLALWLLPLVVVAVMVARDPSRRSVTPVFHLASERWWARSDLYADPRGYHYLPQFALLFAPFHALPAPLGDLLWRGLSVGLVLWGLAAFLRRTGSGEPGRRFLVACALALAPCLGAVRNGQTNLAFAGLCMLLAAMLAADRPGAAALCLVALVALKPLGLVLVLLAPWFYRRLIGPLAAGLAAFVALPFAAAPAAYAAAQYRNAWAHLSGWSVTTESRFADLTALLRTAGWTLPVPASLALRAAAGLITLLLWWRAASRSREPWRALTLVLLGTIYLMLFNPMTEKNSYAIVAPAFAVAAAVFLDRPETRRAGNALAFVLVSVGVLPELLWRVSRNFGLWWDPLTVLAVAIALSTAILRRGDAFAAVEPA